MKKWQVVRRLTPKQKGEILKWLGKGYVFAKHDEHMILYNDGPSNFILRRCPHCGLVHVWIVDVWPPGPVVCGACGKQAEQP